MIEETPAYTIYTIGHSTHPLDEFLALLRSFSISLVVDIRSFPTSKRYPQFSKENLDRSLNENSIGYLHLVKLGGRKKPVVGSINTRWRNMAFRGYADYMETHDFKGAVSQLEDRAISQKVAFMCAEAVWWSCHRSLISDYLKIKGWKVMHIMGPGKSNEHPYTSAARITGGQLRYDEPELF